MAFLYTFARRTGTIVVALVLVGCATFSPDGGYDAVHRLASERAGLSLALPARNADPARASSKFRELLAGPLTVDNAVAVALQNNAGLKDRLAGLGVAEADLVQASRFANPRFSFSNRHNSEAVSIDRTLLFNVMSLLTMPLSQKVAARQFEAAQLQAAGDVLELVIDTRRAWFSAVAAQQTATYFEQAQVAAEAAAELANGMAAAGNINKLSQMREQAFLADTTTQLAKAKFAAATERERLTRLLGVAGPEARIELPDRLPDLPGTPVDARNAEQTAVDRRLDVLLAKRSAEATAFNLGLLKATGVVNVLEVGYTNENNTGEARMNGYEIEVQLPLFDWGDAKVARARAVYMQSVARAAQVAVNAQSEARQAYQAYRTAFDIARRYRDEIVPLRKRIADENLLRYNGMLTSAFELLADAREQITSVNASIEALRDFWIADAELQLAQNGRSSTGGSARPTAAIPTSASGAGH